MTYSSIFIALFAFVYQCVGHTVDPEITTRLGKIIGTKMVTQNGRNINAFLGIPYAQPPIGLLRFSNPLPMTSWNGTLLAKTEPPACPQLLDNGTVIGVEDCLFINVYTPKLGADTLLPTMVYIHGGAFQRGHASSTYIGPGFILDKDVVLVTLQYRLGVLGFLSTGNSAAPGNFGLKDQALALRWVQDNIKSFGGNPGNVTLFGQSSGSVSVNFHVLSKASRGLFHRYIAQSGVALCPWAHVNPTFSRKYAYALGQEFGCSNVTSDSLVKCLRHIDHEKLITTTDIYSGVQKFIPMVWIPTTEPNVDGAFLTEHPLKTILGSRMQDLPNISGAVKNEGLIVTTKFYVDEKLYNSALSNVTEFLSFMASAVLSKNDSNSLGSNLEKYYFYDVDTSDRTQVLSVITDLISDFSFLFPQVLQLQLISQRTKSSCYFYSFEYRGTFSKTSSILHSNKNIGVTHGDDLIYLFPSSPAEYDFLNLTMSDEDKKMVNIMVDLWTNFAIHGVPKTSYHKDPDQWKPYSHNSYHLRIGSGDKATLTGQTHYHDSSMHFWAIQTLKLLIWSNSMSI
ncbi:esterase FE4-like [Chelonus insularis]|uniref:esterase FE4-like n=1 Tax=Chelonus insularis TaxID=460826 RepID=UPI0015882BCC|nr:esterase FE4-like [Chelonus insularis]